MHAIHPDPLRAFLTAAAALVLTIAVLAFPATVGELGLGLGAADGPRAQPAAATGPAESTAAAEPRWVRDPLSPPRLATTR